MRKKKIYTCLLTVFLIVGLFLSFAGAQEVADEIQKQYSSVKSFRAEFSQELTNSASGESEQRRGTIWYEQPQNIRWETTSPEEEILVSTKETVWDYFPEENVVYRYSLQGRFDSKTMLKFISGEVNLKEDFQIEIVGEDSECFGWTKVELVPIDPEPSLVKAYIWMDEESSLIRQVLLVDFFGNSNRLRFDDIELNVDIQQSRFEFAPPEDVEVMKGGR